MDIFSCFCYCDENNHIHILSLGKGTRCLDADKNKRGIQGCLLHDSNTEVIARARRSLLRLFYDEIIHENNSIFIKHEEKKFIWNKIFSSLFVCTYSPCGSAAYLSDPIKLPC